MKILIIDDNISITKALEKFLHFKGFDCTSTNSGRDGVERIKDGRFDVVLLDIAMPGFTGFDVIKTLQKENKTRDQKIIILTATPLNENDEKKLKDAGVYSIQKKPMDVGTLIEAMS